MTDPLPIAQSDLLCTQCGGQCRYAPATRALQCDSCGTDHAIHADPNIDPAAELHYDPALPHTEQPEFQSARAAQCQTCGGEVVFHGASISENCPYCDGSLIEKSVTQSYPSLGVIPFSVEGEPAHVAAIAWATARWAAPGDLGRHVAKSDVIGIYVPFWTFDSDEAVDYTVTYENRSGKTTSLRSHRGFMNTRFDDLLMPASPHVTPLIRDGILHEFDPRRLRPFDPAYLAGFAAERHHQTVRQGLALNEPDKKLLLRNRIKSHSGRSGIVNVTYKTDTTGIRYRRILLPVWILHYEYKGTPYKIVTCGIQGRTFGERPFDGKKLIGFAALAAAAMAGLGFIWGAMGLY